MQIHFMGLMQLQIGWVLQGGIFCYNVLPFLPLGKYWFIPSRHFAYLPTGEKKQGNPATKAEVLI